MGGGPPDFPQGSTCLAVLRILPGPSFLRVRGFHPFSHAFPGISAGFPDPFRSPLPRPARQHGLGWSPFARRYSGNRCFFLFLRLLRCFSSPGSPRMPMDSAYGAGSPSRRVSPFRHLRVSGYLPLTAAFRSLSRLSSALSAKASALRPYKLGLSYPTG